MLLMNLLFDSIVKLFLCAMLLMYPNLTLHLPFVFYVSNLCYILTSKTLERKTSCADNS